MLFERRQQDAVVIGDKGAQIALAGNTAGQGGSVIETVHVLMYEWRYAVAVIAVLGILYSVTLYTKAMFALSAPSTQTRTRRRQARKRQSHRQANVALADHPEAAPPDASTVDWQEDDDADAESAQVPDSAPQDTTQTVADEASAVPAASAGDQFSLLDSLPDDSVAGSSTLEKEDDTDDEYDSRATERVAKTPSAKSEYGVDPNARTRHDLSSPRTDAYGINEQSTVAITKSSKDTADVSDEAASPPPDQSHPNQVKTESIAAPPPSHQRAGVDDLELLRRASRMEELGFHVGIIPARLRHNPHEVSDAEKQALLDTLGQLEEHIDPYGPGTEPIAEESQGSSDVALDDILAKLDHALADEFPGDAESSTQVPSEDHLAKNTPPEAATTIIRSSEPPTTLHRASQDEPAEPPEEQVEDLDAGQQSQDPAVQKEASNDTDEPDVAAHHHEAATQDPDPAVVDDPNAVTDSPAADSDEDLTPPPSPPPRRKPGRIPDWARADTFDEDVDDDDGKQLDLFDKPEQ